MFFQTLEVANGRKKRAIKSVCAFEGPCLGLGSPDAALI